MAQFLQDEAVDPGKARAHLLQGLSFLARDPEKSQIIAHANYINHAG